ncbi:MAG: multidrug efflux SMR transporter [Bacillota bacterium]|nr:multidrug efflux SMR transporter [Bacillota bacterium]
MHWIYLVFAILFEVAGTTSMKFSNGFDKLLPSILMAVFYILSLGSLTLALKKLDVSIAYAIWSGLGTTLIAILGIVLFKETFNTFKVISVILIILGVVGLNLSNTKI